MVLANKLINTASRLRPAFNSFKLAKRAMGAHYLPDGTIDYHDVDSSGNLTSPADLFILKHLPKRYQISIFVTSVYLVVFGVIAYWPFGKKKEKKGEATAAAEVPAKSGHH